MNNSVSAIGQSAFFAPTVFNYYQPNYVVPGSTILGPEFGIYTTSTSIGRANLFATYAFNGLTVAAPDRPNGTKLNLAEVQAVSRGGSDSNQLMDLPEHEDDARHDVVRKCEARSCRLSQQWQRAIHSLRSQTAIYLIATSSQYQVQR